MVRRRRRRPLGVIESGPEGARLAVPEGEAPICEGPGCRQWVAFLGEPGRPHTVRVWHEGLGFCARRDFAVDPDPEAENWPTILAWFAVLHQLIERGTNGHAD